MNNLVFNLNDLVLLITSLLNLCLFFLLFRVKSKVRYSNLFLSLYFLQQAFIPLDILLSFSSVLKPLVINLSENIFHIFGFAYWLDGPLLLWFVRSILRKDYKLSYMDALYLVPLVVYLGYQIYFYFSINIEDKANFLTHSYDLYNLPSYIFYAGLFREAFRCFCGVMCFIELWRFDFVRHTVGFRELPWIKVLVSQFFTLKLLLLVGMLTIFLPTNITTLFNSPNIGLLSNYVSLIFVLVFIVFVSEKLDTKRKHPVAQDAYDRIYLTKTVTQDQVDLILQYMEQKKPYLTSNLTIENLARQLKLSTRSLSFVLNNHFNCNFFEFISNYRIGEAKHLLSNHEHKDKNVISILLECGFNSKASFNSLFKSKVGETPSAFRKRYLVGADLEVAEAR